MRAFTVGPAPIVLSLAVLLAGCGGASLSNNTESPFAPQGPPPPQLFISPFGEAFLAEPGAAYPSAVWFAGADSDGDGVVTQEEFIADGLRVFASLDTDRDGRLNQTELLAYEQGLHRFGRGGPGGPGGDAGARQTRPNSRMAMPRGGGPRGYGAVAEAGFFNLPQPVKSADVNVDQRVTAEEWAAATQRWFQALDTDRDGRLTQATLPITVAQAAAARHR